MKGKQPKSALKVIVEKKPKSIGIPQSPQNLVWSFSVMDFEGPFGWDKCDDHEKFIEIFKRKKLFEGMTYNEILKTESHPIETYRLSKEARDRLVDLKLDEWDEVFSLRLTGRNRVFCLKDEGVMRILWWDPEHLVYPVEKKHT